MRAICYENTKTTLPNWSRNDFLHEKQHFGYAYEINGFFVHFYGASYGLQTISPGLTVIEKNKDNISLEDWVIKTFGAINIKKMKTNIGEVIKGIWNPGLCYPNEIYNALNTNESENLEERQTLYILLKSLFDILLYIEPSSKSLSTYSHELRNLLILSCTEVENQFISILKLSNINSTRRHFDMNDYVILLKNSNIKYFQVNFVNYNVLNNIVPFKNWSKKKPTQSLKWYDAYNKTKHNRSEHFDKSSLINVINAIAANIVLYCIRFGPYELFNRQDVLSSYINQIINITFAKECKTKFYIPLLKIPSDCRTDIFCFDSYRENMYEIWKQKDLHK